MSPTPGPASDLVAQRLALRQQFLLPPDVVFLNHGSFGACPRPVFETYQAWQLELEREPVEFLARRFTDLMRHAREALAAYVGAAADELVYVPNATTGLNIVARSLPLQPGDEVLASDHEYGALDRTWRFVCARRGARYINQPLPLPVESAEQVVKTLWLAVNERTRVLFLSHITSPTALILPVAELVRRAREAGILTVVDGAHAPGQIPLDLSALGADFYSGNCHKWLCAPKGSAFLYARRDMQHLIEPLVVSWGWEEDRPDRSGRPVRSFVNEQEWQGTRDPAAFLSVPAAIQFQAEHDWPRVRAECHELLRDVGQRLGQLTGLPPICPDQDPTDLRNPSGLHMWYAQMASFPLPPCDAAALQRRLFGEYHIEVPVIEWNGRQFVRVSVQGYNTAEDVAALAEALGGLPMNPCPPNGV
jgi:isopenicillin-N epimerase